jgi:DNA excision repair protein ERCC-2
MGLTLCFRTMCIQSKWVCCQPCPLLDCTAVFLFADWNIRHNRSIRVTDAAYMKALKQALDAEGHCILEMPTGTGKTITLLSLIVAYISRRADASQRKLVFATRTIEEMGGVLNEVKALTAARERETGAKNALVTIGLASRRHLCVHPRVSQNAGGGVDSGCRSITASWVREASRNGESVELCEYFENFETQGEDCILRPGVYDLHDMREYGRRRKWCPYFTTRHMVRLANVVVFSYHYLIDPRVSSIVSSELTGDTIVVFDECQNIECFFFPYLSQYLVDFSVPQGLVLANSVTSSIRYFRVPPQDNVSVESLTVDLAGGTLDAAGRNVTALTSSMVNRHRQEGSRLLDEYNRLSSNLEVNPQINMNYGSNRGRLAGGEDIPGAPVLPADILRQAVPDTIRKAESFVALLRRLIRYLKQMTAGQDVLQQRSVPFLAAMTEACNIDSTTLRMIHDRLMSLMRTLEVASWHEFSPLAKVADFITTLATYSTPDRDEGFVCLFEPFDDFTGERTPWLRLVCCDPGLALRWIFERFSSVVLTSGTLSPLDFYPRILSFSTVVSASFNRTMSRECVLPCIVSRGKDQTLLSSAYSDRATPDVARNYGELLVEMAQCVPDGIICFFVSYAFCLSVVRVWEESGLLAELQRARLVFVETRDPIETALAISSYRAACDSGRGAILLSVARGRAAEGVDFDHHYGRAVLLIGVPFQYTESRVLKAKLAWLAERHNLAEDDYLCFDAMRQAAQCAGRVIRNKKDYGIVLLCDRRYVKVKLRSKLPRWIKEAMCEATTGIDVGSAAALSKKFLLSMAQPMPASGTPPLLD